MYSFRGRTAAKTVDFMLTPNTLKEAEKTNQFFEQNTVRFIKQLEDHANAADFVPLPRGSFQKIIKPYLRKQLGIFLKIRNKSVNI
ncbi:hypothetical protein [Allorhizobium taibaishanense]|uniref:hypothetical protein n=1 Tax=Allorhizobium taibaishanense TaxID=887144 RepID=UPI001AED257C